MKLSRWILHEDNRTSGIGHILIKYMWFLGGYGQTQCHTSYCLIRVLLNLLTSTL